MKKILLISLLLTIIFSFSIVNAAEKVPLGAGNLALKIDYINFTDSQVEDFDTDDGIYVGLETYGKIADVSPHFYVGMEVGYTNIDGNVHNFDTETTYVPVELNLKYALKISPDMTIDFGAGPSINYAKIETTGSGMSIDEDDWVWGGQIFADLVYKFRQFFAGVNAKYQVTENFEIHEMDTDMSFRNWRIGGQVGIMF